jgi:hypothetical protein
MRNLMIYKNQRGPTTGKTAMLKPTGEATCTEGQRTARRDREAAGDVPTTHEHTSGDPLPLGVAARPHAAGVLRSLRHSPLLKLMPVPPHHPRMMLRPVPLVPSNMPVSVPPVPLVPSNMPVSLVPLPPHHPRMMLRRPCRAAALREDEAAPLPRMHWLRRGMPHRGLGLRTMAG